MTQQNLYLAIQRLDLSAALDAKWAALITAMQAKGENGSDQPHKRNHWRPSLDESMYIFHASFNSAVIDVDWFISWLAGEFGINEALIGDATGYNAYGRFSTLSYPAGVTNRIRIGVFGFESGQGWPARGASRAAAVAYMIANSAEWEPVAA